MSSQTRLSAKGQVVIPKDVRDALGLRVGQEFDVIASGAGVLLRPKVVKSGRSFEEITACIRARIKYDGPPVSIEEMKESIGEMFAQNGPRWDK
jgi:AbrB family looped-hinge helix DNA binding protein